MYLSAVRARCLLFVACAAASSCVGPGLEPPNTSRDAPLPIVPTGGASAPAAHGDDSNSDGGPKKPEVTSDAGTGPLADTDAGAGLDDDGGRVDHR
jgi:hypothetical protein